MNKFFGGMLFLCILFLCGFQAQALTIGDPDPLIWGDLDPKEYKVHGGTDYGDAVGYGTAQNTRGWWQGLGTDNSVDDGVKWSVGGSEFGTDADLIIGEEVTFKFLFWQLNNGRHDYDQIFASFDFGQDNYFNDGDTILYEMVSADYIHDKYDDSRNLSEYQEFTLSIIIPETMEVGTTWLRTRAHCWHTTYPNVDAYKDLAQGETEDYELNIVAAPVPEPATMCLLGFGLLGVAAFRRKVA